MTKPFETRKNKQPCSQMKISIPRSANTLLVAIDRGASVPEIHVDFSSIFCSVQLNGPVIINVVHEMLEGKANRTGDMIFPSIGPDIDPAIGF